MAFPITRMRRLRKNEALRRMVRETSLSVDDFIYPLFVVYGENKKIPVTSMPGVYQLSCDMLESEIQETVDLGIPAVLLFGIPENKDAAASSAYDDNGVVQQAVRLIKDRWPELLVITDVCLCEYTDHGHCGVVTGTGTIDNDATLELLAQEALSHAKAGADIVAPSDMMDGRIGYIREALDASGFADTAVMAYAAKYASGFYGPFREAAESAPQFGDRKTYQMDPANSREALREIELDLAEGADIIMVKPALAYLDVIARVRERFNHPLAAYNVSGEYAMVKAAAANGWLDEERIMMEVLTAIKRAGADIIITYFAKEAARLLG
ncbi:MAG TPA: porphobilinogen synthase [Syntrophothermus lipocalidus]|uniref:Delta-aminolevulinic acid dehydratase n=1 Tax=Syntrophothermus lipocalidus (strain DSM 12680 / TGB-C1) TaxID=643648 RepID=D7CNA2_SYNLT|nr:porphobilinogen synthase [Syntrophothermus lipocalidus]ADI02187.1 Porphobilinogen synthase [Syntrophothermus lipocalidus DSM 12680]HHV75970.1 porphobilinogen synthase [Syntrophothermus lipocalidus]